MSFYLIATHHNLIAMEVADESEELIYTTRSSDDPNSKFPIDIGFTTLESGWHYYGIAVDPAGNCWVAKNSMSAALDGSDLSSHIFNICTGEELLFDTPIKDIHQITYANGGLYVTNTYYNGVVYKNLTTGVEHAYTIGGPFEQDYAHPNSLWIDGRYVWVMLHNKRQRVTEIARLIHGEKGFFRGWQSEIRYRLGDNACHNFRFDRALMHYNSSEDAQVVKFDHIMGIPRGATQFEKGLYIKGMTTNATGKLLVVGLNPWATTEERYSTSGQISFIDWTRGAKHVEVPLELPEGNAANINEIRRVPPSLF